MSQMDMVALDLPSARTLHESKFEVSNVFCRAENDDARPESDANYCCRTGTGLSGMCHGNSLKVTLLRIPQPSDLSNQRCCCISGVWLLTGTQPGSEAIAKGQGPPSKHLP